MLVLDEPQPRGKGHGQAHTRIYECWFNMRARSRKRQCMVWAEWLKFDKFKEWALANGYKDNLVLCRIGDKGHYEPTNVRWDTVQSNSVERHSKTWEFLNPDNNLIVCNNLEELCRQHKLNRAHMSRVHSGHLKQHKKWRKKL